jgi:adenylate cyclase
MATGKIRRKLTTIFCADVQSYSTLMAEDEAETLRRLQRYRAIMNDLFERHEGRKVNTWGDAVIAEFASVVEAVRCGVEIQEAIGAENRSLPPERQMWFRIGINLGDVMQDGDDLYGDGVNVAARLESLAEAGGILVSETVFDLTRRHLSVSYEFVGEQDIKGRDAPIPGYRVRMQGQAGAATDDPVGAPGAETAPAPTPPTAARRPARAGMAAAGARMILRPEGRLDRFVSWYRRQPRMIRAPLAMIGLFAVINILTSGLSNLWFVYPSIPFAIALVIGLLRTQR